LVQEIPNTDSCFRIAIDQSSVTRMHCRWNVFSLASLIAPYEIAIKDFEYQSAEIVGVYRMERMSFNVVPARLCQLRGCISTSIGNKASIILQRVRTLLGFLELCMHTYIIASSSFMLLKTSNPPTFHSPLSPVYKDPTRRAPWTDEASSLINLIDFCKV